ncbi:hypothetical protein [Deinococcus navajonensis]|uniref:Uncharacterized protein n=1 Tax=Deinococcus navajonensis TaxID=309884 RepID=A0ABV8XRV8_9DEIO
MHHTDDSPLSTQARLDALRAMLLRLISDGQLTDAEMQLLVDTRSALHLSDQAVRSLRGEIYHTALRQAQQHGRVTARDAELLDRIVQFVNGGVWLTEHFGDRQEENEPRGL